MDPRAGKLKGIGQMENIEISQMENIEISQEVTPYETGCDCAVVLKTTDLSKMNIKFHMLDNVAADAFEKILTEMLESFNLSAIEASFACWEEEAQRSENSKNYQQMFTDLRDRVNTMANAMKKRGLKQWVKDWLSDGILEGGE